MLAQTFDHGVDRESRVLPGVGCGVASHSDDQVPAASVVSFKAVEAAPCQGGLGVQEVSKQRVGSIELGEMRPQGDVKGRHLPAI